MKLYLHLIKISEIELKSANFFSDISDEILLDFLMEYCNAYEFEVEELVENEIKKFEVKHNKTTKMPKFTLQLYSFLYHCLMNFPAVKFDEIKTVTTDGFMKELYRVVNYKVHIHHLHVTGKIHGYSHDFCNWKTRENQLFVPLIGHNFLGFDIYYMVKGYRSSVWGTNDFRMGGTNLVDVNFANISTQIKIIDTLKYYQTSLANISNTANKTEKKSIAESVEFFIKGHYYFSNICTTLNQKDKERILDIISKGKGALPYEKIVDLNSLEVIPEKEFFEYTEFFSKLNGHNIPTEIYEDMKYLYTILKMRNLGDMNDLYNMQDFIFLCEIIENRFEKMHKKFGFNPRKCNSASTLSGCVQRNQSKVIISLPTNYEHAEIFEKTLIGGYSCVNNRIGFGTEVLLSNFSKSEYARMSIDESFKAFKNQNYKIRFTIKLDNDEKSKEYRVISKAIKLDENNQYGFAMTKPMPVGAIKEKKASWTEFNMLFEKVSLDDKKGHIFIVDIEFDHLHATDCQIMYNEILPPFIEKDTKIEANKSSVYHLLELYSEDIRGCPKKYKIWSKAHSNLFAKKIIPLYLEEIKFTALGCGWKVTKLYKHYYFDQERCKRNFILMNQKGRQEAPDKVESDFCKLLNNANFGYDCRNNLDNCTFQPIRDEINELSFIKRYHSNLYDKDLEQFITARVLQEDINERFNNERQKIKETDTFFAAKVRSIENRRNAENEALESFKKREKKQHKKTGLTSFVDRLEVTNKNEKVKSIMDFSDQDTASIKALSVKQMIKLK